MLHNNETRPERGDFMRSRTAALAGIAFVVLYVVAWFVSKTPDSDASSAQIADYYSDRGNRILMIVSAYLFVVSGLVFLHFITGIRARLVADARHAAEGTFVVAAGAVFVGLLMAGAMALAAVPASISFDSSSGTGVPTSGDVVSIIQSAGYGMILVGGMLSAAAMILAASLLIMRTRLLPGWTAWLGFAAAVVLLFAVVWVPQIALVIWVLALSIVMLRAPSAETSVLPTRASTTPAA
jgi:MFS family permease